MKFNWKKTIGAIAPLIGTAVGGPFAGLAVAAVKRALSLPDDANEQQVEQAVKNATPEQLIKLRNADNEFKTKMRELDIREDELVYKDIDSARKREVELGGDATLKGMAICTVVGFFVFVGFLLINGTPDGMDKTLLGMLIGYVVGIVQQVYNYFFGSSKGSNDKTKLGAAK